MTFTRMISMVMGLVGLRIGGAVLNLASQIIFARLFVPTDVGIIFLSMSTAALFGLIATLGYPWLVLTQFPRFEALGLTKITRAFHGAFLRDGLTMIITIVVACLLAALVFDLPSETKTALLFACLATPASMVMRYGSSIANSYRRFTLS